MLRRSAELRDAVVQVLTEDIVPALDKLRKEKGQYHEWQNASSNLDSLRRFCVAYKYEEAKRCATLEILEKTNPVHCLWRLVPCSARGSVVLCTAPVCLLRPRVAAPR